MPRYFIEVAYKGKNYAGFQIQQNANTIQQEIQKSLKIFTKQNLILTGSSRTDAGVHAKQNFFHVDVEDEMPNTQTLIYHLNAILPYDIVIKSFNQVQSNAHCRFDALSRSYQYTITQQKNPFLLDDAYFFPYQLDFNALKYCTSIINQTENFKSFSKKNTQVYTHICQINQNEWHLINNALIYTVNANRFLRGMVRGLVATMLLVGRGKLSIQQFVSLIESQNAAKTDFSAPAKGLVLQKVQFPQSVYNPI